MLVESIIGFGFILASTELVLVLINRLGKLLKHQCIIWDWDINQEHFKGKNIKIAKTGSTSSKVSQRTSCL